MVLSGAMTENLPRLLRTWYALVQRNGLRYWAQVK
jgi:hypothetical protein